MSASQVESKLAPLVRNEKSATAIAEAVLFDIYGEKSIKAQRPYKVVDTGGTWRLSGTLAPTMLGGVFHIEISKTNGMIVDIGHSR